MTSTDAPLNVVVLRGDIRGVPRLRDLPDASCVLQFDVATTVDGRRHVAPVVLEAPTAGDRAALTDGVAVVVVGAVRRRFFRAAGATQSRTEVVASSAVPRRRAATVARLLDATVADIVADAR